MTGVVVALLWVGLSGCLGLHITPCGDDQKQQVEETGDAVFVCTDIRTAEVRWRVTYTNQPDLVLGTCNSVDKCNVRADNVSIIRPVSDTSLLIVTEDHRRLAGTLECAELNGGQFAGSATCQLHVVYTSYNVTCTTTVNNTDWTVRGTCHVDKIYNSDGDYTCQWQQQPSLGSTIPGHQSLVPFTDSTGQQYQRMTCSFTTPMPTADGPHDFVLTVDPRNRPGDTHRGQSVDIQSPKGPPVLHNCPSDVVEGDDVTCTCQASASKPPALVTWNDVNTTATLQLTSVQKSQTYRHTCSQFWGGLDADHMTMNYTVNAKYPPSSPPVITGVTSYSAGDTLNLTCTVMGGNPPVTSVTFYCGDHADGDDVTEGQRVVLGSTAYARDNGSVCLCSGLWRDRPSLYADTTSVTISVHGTDPEDSSFPVVYIVAIAVGASVLIIIVVVVVVVVIRRRRGKQQKRKRKKNGAGGGNGKQQNKDRRENRADGDNGKQQNKDRRENRADGDDGKQQNKDHKENGADGDDVFVEHVNIIYESADGPEPGQAKPFAAAFRVPADGAAKAHDQEAETEIEGSYSTIPSVVLGSSASNTARTAHVESGSDPYSSADPSPNDQLGLKASADGGVANPGFVIEANPQQADTSGDNKPGAQNNDYAVVNKSGGNPKPSAQPAGSGDPEGDLGHVYAQVKKKPKGGSPVCTEMGEGSPDGKNEEGAQKNPQDSKPTPAPKPKKPAAAATPSASDKQPEASATTTRQGRQPVTPDYETVEPVTEQKTSMPEDDYNTLKFNSRPSPENSQNPDPTYSHIGAVSQNH